jgi:hypothetical protein
MWLHYKTTFLWVQIAICVVTGVVFLQSHVAFVATTYFLTMQVAAVIGAAWASRLRRKALRDRGFLPR